MNERACIEAEFSVGIFEHTIGRQREEWSSFCQLAERGVHPLMAEVRTGVPDNDGSVAAVGYVGEILLKVRVAQLFNATGKL